MSAAARRRSATTRSRTSGAAAILTFAGVSGAANGVLTIAAGDFPAAVAEVRSRLGDLPAALDHLRDNESCLQQGLGQIGDELNESRHRAAVRGVEVVDGEQDGLARHAIGRGRVELDDGGASAGRMMLL